MSRSPIRATFVLTALVAALALPAAAGAQDGTPAVVASPPPAGVTIPDPAECDVTPRSIAEFEQIAATPPAPVPNAEQRFSKPGNEPRPWTMPAGTPADDATITAVTATLREALACLNAGDFLRFTALFSDEMIDILFTISPLPPEAIPSLAASPVPSPPDQWLGYLRVHDVRILPDGRVAGLGDNYDPTEPPYGMGTDFAIFVNVGDQWLIDSLIENVVITGEATPAAG
ncbi:MAG: hypothetical protein ACJ8BC_18960 [Gemmatimonadales bacterium]